ncbi:MULTISPECIES: dihydroxyacetone kinase family protein [unclassified Halomonas]|uniref:dihydroxyacetone kinase family protein n=1 Tax=unclassified Halomonas TaxID=2609666 RepID=UPI001C966CE6|nr:MULTISPECIES: dihydroxyacetone kinase family protein [unclassified Halomonas]MBY5924702.1 dihydroxyacetone kinase family protein [Halomonas sp. DP4Y7-2]MBY6231744.1 dihydroxyacetone kinase family protein [Halomonas sp. DP4Y7-1]
MTRLYNDPSDFSEQARLGLVAAHAEILMAVPGGVVRSTRSAPGSVAVVIGGGSGHYPAFAGLVGQGLAHGAAMGNLFASPSAQQVYSVAKAADNGGGVLLTFGNYAGDVLHFGQARERLIEEGIPCEIVLVTDDISSASFEQIDKRRGIAGDLTVFKAASAAAEAGADLEEVVRVAQEANRRTRSFGVAFDGCTLPGGEGALFHVPQGRMALGLGIHGEPGISERDVPSADGLAETLVERVLSELPEGVSADGGRAAVILNGLGTIKYEELFVVYRRVDELLRQAGVVIVEPDVGELVTSLDMAGVSLTLFWLDDEMERLWRAPANCAAYRKGSLVPAKARDAAEVVPTQVREVPPASDASRQLAKRVVEALAVLAKTVDYHCDELGRIDAVAGDGDHGIGMQRGSLAGLEAARGALEQGAGAQTVLRIAADAWADRGGGTSGAIWGVILTSLGDALGDHAPLSAERLATGVSAASENVMQFGKARPGDKTLVDVLVPFASALYEASTLGVSEAWDQAAAVARQSADATAELLPKVGRARPLAEKSLGTPDPGAVSLSLIITAIAPLLRRCP